MRNVLLILFVVSVMSCGAFGADGQLTQSTLADMGLAGIQVMSDVDGLDVRGKFASAWGSAYSSFFGNNANAGYVSSGAAFASGGAIAMSGGFLDEQVAIVGAGGYSWATSSGFGGFRFTPN